MSLWRQVQQFEESTDSIKMQEAISCTSKSMLRIIDRMLIIDDQVIQRMSATIGALLQIPSTIIDLPLHLIVRWVPRQVHAVPLTLPLSRAGFAGIRQTDSNLTNLKLLALYIFKQFRYIFVKIPKPSLRPEQT